MDWDLLESLGERAPAMVLLVVVVWLFLRHITRSDNRNHDLHVRISDAADRRDILVIETINRNTDALAEVKGSQDTMREALRGLHGHLRNLEKPDPRDRGVANAQADARGAA